MDHEQKLDFVVLSIPDFPRLLTRKLGVQLTTWVADVEKRQEFFRHSSETSYVERYLYLEADPSLDLERGGAFTILAAITAFLVDQRFTDWVIGAVRVSSDLTYRFSDEHTGSVSLAPEVALAVSANSAAQHGLPQQPRIPLPEMGAKHPAAEPAVSKPPQLSVVQPVASPARPLLPIAAAPVPATPTRIEKISTPNSSMGDALKKAGVASDTFLTGTIVFFDGAAGIGKIEMEGKKQEFFLHRNNITDKNLLDEINALCRTRTILSSLHIQIAVKFTDGGKTRGKQNNVAVSVQKAAGRATTV